MNDDLICKYCKSANVVKYGTFEGVQRYWCKDCKRKFVDNDALTKMRTPVKVIASAVGMYYGGMPLDSIQRQLAQDYCIRMSESGIYYRVVRFSRDAVNKAKAFKPKTGDTWVCDETVLKIGGRNVWFFDIIDYDSRYLLASRLALTRTTKDAALVLDKARDACKHTPKRIITDKLSIYPNAIEYVFGADTKHIASKPFTDVDSTNIIERFHGTLKDRTNAIRGFKNMDTAQLLTDAWLVHYNFMKEHETLGNLPPAQAMGNPVPFRNWRDIISKARTAPEVKLASYVVSHKPAQKRTATIRKRRDIKHKRQSISMPRLVTMRDKR